MIANCGSNEFGSGYGGQAGDQTGKEYTVMNWYSRPWKCVLRYPDLQKAIVIAQVSRDAANNNNIGYDMGQRMTFYNQLAAVGWNPASITTPCESDCSASTSACIIAAGHKTGDSRLMSISPSLTTHVMRSSLRAAGFMLLTDSRYLSSDAYLLPGDILLNDGAHAAVNLDSGPNSGESVIVSDGSALPGGIGGGDLYATENDEDDAIMREVAYLSGNTPTVNKTNIRLSVINYTSSLQAIFKGKVGTGGGSYDSSKLEGNYRVIFDYLVGKGLNAAAACGILANIRGESNGNPNLVGTADAYGSIGICQWTFGRKTALLNFVNGNWRNNLSGQLDFLWHELNGSYRNSVLIPLQNEPNTEAGARDAAYVFVSKFEIPQRYYNGRDIYMERVEWASEFWSQIVIQQSTIANNSGGPKLTKSAGKIIYNGHIETWYSQRVLPGGGLNIPGRHVASDGTIRDKDNYICVASDTLPKGSTIMTSLGMGKVYDTGVGHSGIDIYTDW